MITSRFASIVVAVLATTISAGAVTNMSHSKTIVVQSPSTLPILALKDTEAMYLHKADDGTALLYVESAEGTNLTILDVTDPGRIRRVHETSLEVPSAFDFVEPIGNNSVLLRYRNGSGEALLSVKRSNHPALGQASALAGTEAAEKLGETGLLSASTNVAAPTANSDPTYKVWDSSKAAQPVLLATVPGVTQRLSNEDTGTVFLLSRDGVTLVRRLRVEEDHKIDVMWKSQP